MIAYWCLQRSSEDQMCQVAIYVHVPMCTHAQARGESLDRLILWARSHKVVDVERRRYNVMFSPWSCVSNA